MAKTLKLTKSDKSVRSSNVIDSRYSVEIVWSEEDQAFIARVPELPGCMADGETYGAAVNAVQIIIAEWIETARELGREIPSPRSMVRKLAA